MKLLKTLFLVLWGTSLLGQTFNSGYSVPYSHSTVNSDAIGNTYTTGNFFIDSNSTIDFDPAPGIVNNLTSGKASTGVYIQKFDASHNLVWVKHFIDTALGTPHLLPEPSGGGLYISGTYLDTLDADPGSGTHLLTNPNSNSAYYLIKLDSNGNFVWATDFQVNTTLFPQKIDLDLDPSGNIYWFVSYQLSSTNRLGHLEKFSPSGSPLWNRDLDGNILTIEVDAQGDFLASGFFEDTLHVTSMSGNTVFTLLTPTASTGVVAMPIIKYNASGNPLWAKKIDGATARDINVALTGNIYLTGQYSGSRDFDPGAGVSNLPPPFYPQPSASTTASFTLKLQPNGDFEWANSIGHDGQGTNLMIGARVISLITGEVAVLYWGVGLFDVDPGRAILNYQLVDHNVPHIALTVFASSGELLYAGAIGSNYGITGISADANNVIHLVNTFGTTAIDIDPGAGIHLVPNLGMPSGSSYLVRLKVDSCDFISAALDSFSNVSCSDSGIISVDGRFGKAPYQYAWNTNPVKTGPTLTTDTSGTYKATITDINGCVTEKVYQLSGPKDQNNLDLTTELAQSGTIRPGSTVTVWLDAINNSCILDSGQLKLRIDTSLTHFMSSVPSPIAISGDTLIWDFTNAQYGVDFMSPAIVFEIDTAAQVENPVCFESIICGTGVDIDSTNNEKAYCFPLVNSYDPNDISVYPVGQCKPRYVPMGQTLTYTVRFQNTGNAQAIDVSILDTLNLLLDSSSIRVVATSHESPIVELLPKNVVRFDFNNIYLPDSSSQPINSQGYVTFEIDPKPNILNNSLVDNKVAIVFDYNPPIITNKVKNTFTNNPLPDVSVSRNSCSFMANSGGLNYQWLNCVTNQIISGASGQSYTPTQNGEYAVIVTTQLCSDTSECLSINNVSLEDHFTDQFAIYPNPNNGQFTVQQLMGGRNITMEVYNTHGQLVYQGQSSEASTSIKLDGSKGIYILNLKTEGQEASFRLVKL